LSYVPPSSSGNSGNPAPLLPIPYRKAVSQVLLSLEPGDLYCQAALPELRWREGIPIPTLNYVPRKEKNTQLHIIALTGMN
jgi:hypothetical protein